MTEMRDDELKGQPRMLGDCACGCMNDPDFAPPPDGLPDRLATARDDLRRESDRTEMAFRERDAALRDAAAERAERDNALRQVRHLREELDAAKVECDTYSEAAHFHAGRASVLVAALEFYAKTATYEESAEPHPTRFVTGVVPIEADLGEIARAVLSSEDATRPTPECERCHGTGIIGNGSVSECQDCDGQGRDATRPTPECDGSSACPAVEHIHGCFSERPNATRPTGDKQ